MKNFTFLFLIILLIVVLGAVGMAAIKTSSAKGTWATAGTWSPSGAPATTDTVVIDGGFTVTVGAAATCRMLTITSGDSLIVSSGITLTVNNGNASGFDLTVSGTLKNAGTITYGTSATGTFLSGSTYQHTHTSGVVPTATWALTSTCLVTGMTGTLPTGIAGQTFGNLTWNCPNQSNTSTAIAGVLTVAGNLTILNTGTYQFRVQTSPITVGGDVYISGGTMWVAGQATKVMNVGGDVYINGGILDLMGYVSTGTTYTGTLNIKGNLSITSGRLQAGGSSVKDSIVFNGSGIQTFTSGGTISNDTILYVVKSGSTLQMADASTVLSGSGTFTLASGATLGITSSAGITASGATGNIQTGSRSFNSGANYIYNGASAQVTGNGLPATVNNLTINNTNGVTLSASTSVTNSLTLSSGSIFDAAGFTLSAGSYSNSGTVRFSGASNGVAIGTGTVDYYGSNQTIAAGTYNNLTLSGSGTVNLSSVAINGTLLVTGNVTATLPSGLSNLTVNSSNGLTLNNPMTISGVLTFTLGNLFLGNNNLTLNGSVSGAAAGQCIVTNGTGGVIQNVAASTSALFPIGADATHYNPVTLTSDIGHAADNFTVRATAGAPAAPNNDQAVQVTWDIAEAVVGGSSVIVDLGWNSSQHGIGFSTFIASLWHYDGGTSTWQDLFGSAVSGTDPFTLSTLSSVSSFSPFCVGNSGALPVEMTSFTAESKGVSAHIRWATATEEKSYNFEIERRMINSSEYAKVGTVQAAGASNVTRTYEFTDANLAPGKYAYRLKMNDNDGSFAYFGNAEISIDAAPKEFSLKGNYPNPFNPSTTIEFTVPQNGHVTLKVYNVIGQQVATLFDGMAQAEQYNKVSFDASKLSSGIYFSTLEFNNQRLVRKMLLTK